MRHRSFKGFFLSWSHENLRHVIPERSLLIRLRMSGRSRRTTMIFTQLPEREGLLLGDSTAKAVKHVGLLRLRGPFASRRGHSAQDDTLRIVQYIAPSRTAGCPARVRIDRRS